MLPALRRCVPIALMKHALLLSRLSRHKQARSLISRFFKPGSTAYRVAPGVWDRACGKTQPKSAGEGLRKVASEHSHVRFFDGAVPEGVHRRLLRAFAPGSAYTRFRNVQNKKSGFERIIRGGSKKQYWQYERATGHVVNFQQSRIII
jgi:hypothetical protein